MKFRQKLDSILGGTLVVIMAVMVVNVLWQVFSRYIVKEPSSFTDELARYLMIWVGVLGTAYVSGKNGHVAIAILPSRLSAKKQLLLKKVVFTCIIVFAFFAMVIGGSRLVYISFLLGQKTPTLQIPLAFLYAVIPLSGLLIMYYKTLDLLKK